MLAQTVGKQHRTFSDEVVDFSVAVDVLSKFQLAPQSVTLEVTLLCAVLPSTIPSVLRFCLRSPLRTHLTEALRQGCVLSTWSPNIRHEQLRQNDVESVSSSCTQLEEITPQDQIILKLVVPAQGTCVSWGAIALKYMRHQ